MPITGGVALLDRALRRPRAARWSACCCAGKVPEVVLLLVLGVVIGPNVLDLAVTGEGVEMLRELGLGMLFLLAGYESRSRSWSARAAAARSPPGWCASGSRSA